MTPQSSRLMDTVDEMLLDAGREQDAELRAALLSLGNFAFLPAPAPNAELAALLGSRPDGLSWRRRLRRHRPAIVGLAVVAGMGLGATGVAATSSGPAEMASVSVQRLLEKWVPSWSVSGLPLAATATGLLPESESEPEPAAAPAEQEAAADSGAAGRKVPPGQEAPDRAAAQDGSPAATAKTGPDDGGADARDASGSPGAAKESAHAESKVRSEPGKIPDSAQEAPRQALEKSEKLVSGAVPENAVSESAGPGGPGNGSAGKSGNGTKADHGTKWLKKFSR